MEEAEVAAAAGQASSPVRRKKHGVLRGKNKSTHGIMWSVLELTAVSVGSLLDLCWLPGSCCGRVGYCGTAVVFRAPSQVNVILCF